MASSTVTVVGWTSLGSAAALIEAKTACGVWIIDAASMPASTVISGDIYLAVGAVQLFQPSTTLWALPGQGAATAGVGVDPQNIASGGGSGSNASVGSTGAAVPASATAVGFQNASGNLVLPTPSAGLPVADSGAAITGALMPAGGVGLTGWLSAIWSSAATAANQTTANTSLASILTKLGSVVLSAGSAIIGKVGIDQTTPGTTNGVVVNSSALPSGAATSANQPSLVATSGGNASRAVVSDPSSGVGAFVSAFHNADNQALGTVYGILTGGVDQLVNGSGNLDRKRGVAGDAMPITGLAAEVPMIFNGASYDRLRSVAGDAASSTGIVQEAVALWNGATYDRWYGDKTNGAWVNVKALPALPAGTNNVGFVSETYANLATAQVSVGATATLIVAARAGRKEVTIVNHGTTALYLGSSSGVTTSTGQLLAGVAGEGITYSGGAAIYGITASGSQTVSAAEVY